MARHMLAPHWRRNETWSQLDLELNERDTERAHAASVALLGRTEAGLGSCRRRAAGPRCEQHRPA